MKISEVCAICHNIVIHMVELGPIGENADDEDVTLGCSRRRGRWNRR